MKQEISQLRTYNSKTFRTSKTFERTIFTAIGIYKNYFGEISQEFHIKPIHYLGNDKQWHDLSEVASYFGNQNGMILKECWEQKINFGYLVWYLKRLQSIRGKGIRLPYTSLPLVVATACDGTSGVACLPDPGNNAGNTSVDGYVARFGVNETWATIRSGAGLDSAPLTADNFFTYIQSSTTSNQWDTLVRAIFTFDTVNIPDGNTINSATLSLNGTAKVDGLGITPDLNIYGSTPASNNALVNADYGQTQNTAFSTAITYANWSTTGFNDFVLNSSGIANINKIGVSTFSAKNANYDAANLAPTWGSSLNSKLNGNYADAAGTASDPKLVVNHSSASISPQMNLTLLGVG